MDKSNNYGLSKKTNITIAAIGGLSVVKESVMAIAAIVVITIVAVTYQFILDKKKVIEK